VLRDKDKAALIGIQATGDYTSTRQGAVFLSGNQKNGKKADGIGANDCERDKGKLLKKGGKWFWRHFCWNLQK
jgi:hypothetical protein